MIVLCEIYICMCVSIHICYIYVCIYSVFPENKDIHQHVGTQPSLWTKSHFHTWLLKKNIALTMQTFVSKVMSLLFKMLCRFVIVFLLRSKCLLILWLQSPSAFVCFLVYSSTEGFQFGVTVNRCSIDTKSCMQSFPWTSSQISWVNTLEY